MACETGRVTAPDDAGRNWAGNITFRAARRHRPSTVDELRRVVAGSERIRAIGTAHSFNRIADSTGDLVSVAGLPPSIRIDAEAATVTVGGAMRYGDFARACTPPGTPCTTWVRCRTSRSPVRSRPARTVRATATATSPPPSGRSDGHGRR